MKVKKNNHNKAEAVPIIELDVSLDEHSIEKFVLYADDDLINSIEKFSRIHGIFL